MQHRERDGGPESRPNRRRHRPSLVPKHRDHGPGSVLDEPAKDSSLSHDHQRGRGSAHTAVGGLAFVLKARGRRACRVAVALLTVAHAQSCERALAERIADGGTSDPKVLANEFAESQPGVLDIAPAVREGSLDRYDGLFGARDGDGSAEGLAPDGDARRMEEDAR